MKINRNDIVEFRLPKDSIQYKVGRTYLFPIGVDEIKDNRWIFIELDILSKDMIETAKSYYGYTPRYTMAASWPEYKDPDDCSKLIEFLALRTTSYGGSTWVNGEELVTTGMIIGVDDMEASPKVHLYKFGDDVTFTVHGVQYKYYINGRFLNAYSNSNDVIFNILGITDFRKFASDTYGYACNGGDFPEYNNNDIVAANKIILAIQKKCKEVSDGTIPYRGTNIPLYTVGDKVDFIVGDAVYTYTIQESHLELAGYNNDVIFNVLGIPDHWVFAEEAYGYQVNSGSWSTCTNKDNIVQLSRLIYDVHQKCNEVNSVKLPKYEVGDKIEFELLDRTLAYEVESGHIKNISHGSTNDQIFIELGIRLKLTFANECYGYRSNGGICPFYKPGDMDAAERLIDKLQEMCKDKVKSNRRVQQHIGRGVRESVINRGDDVEIVNKAGYLGIDQRSDIAIHGHCPSLSEDKLIGSVYAIIESVYYIDFVSAKSGDKMRLGYNKKDIKLLQHTIFDVGEPKGLSIPPNIDILPCREIRINRSEHIKKAQDGKQREKIGRVYEVQRENCIVRTGQRRSGEEVSGGRCKGTIRVGSQSYKPSINRG